MQSFFLFPKTSTKVIPQGRRLALVILLLPTTLVAGRSLHSSRIEKGVVVERVTDGGEGQRAGVRVGDVFLSWRSERGEWHEIESPFDLPWIQTSQAPNASISFRGLRGNARQIWVIRKYGWQFSARVNMQRELLELYEEGHKLAKSGQVDGAVSKWHAAVDLAKASEPPWVSCWLLARSAQWLLWAGRPDDAVREYESAIQSAETLGPIVRADILWQLASALDGNGDTAGAATRYAQVLAEWERLGSATTAVAASLVDLGRLSLRRGELSQAEEYFLRILAMRKFLPRDSVQIAVSYLHLGVIHEAEGDLREAERSYRDALAIELRRSPSDPRLAVVYSDLAALAFQRSNLALSERYYRQALATAHQVSPKSLEEADVLAALADCLAERGHPIEAQLLQTRALTIRQKELPESLTVAESLAGLGRTARIRGELKQAGQYYERALSIAERLVPVPLELSQFLIGQGNVFRAQHDFQKAEACYRRALAIMDKLAPRSANHTDTLGSLAEALQQQGKLAEASEVYKQALEELGEKIVRLGGIDDDQLQYRANHETLFENYMSLLLDLRRPEQAFEVLEASRARHLLEILARGHIDLYTGVDSRLLARASHLRRSISAQSEYQIRLLQGTHSQEQSEHASAELDRFWSEYKELQSEIRASSPGYAALTQPRTMAAEEIQKLLDDDTLLLEYSLASPRSYLWAVTNSSLRVYDLPSGDVVEKLVRKVYRSLNARNENLGNQTHERALRLKQADVEYNKAAAQLSRIVLGPVITRVTKKRLLIVSDGALQYIPFAALPVLEEERDAAPKSRQGALQARRPLIVDHEIVYLPSASVLAELRARERNRVKAPGMVAVLADPVFDASDERVSSARKAGSLAKAMRSRWDEHLNRSASDIGLARDGQVHFNRLLYTRLEAEAIAAIFGQRRSKRSLDFQASRAVAMEPDLGRYKVIHFATHGLVDTRHPEFSGLVLSLVDESGNSKEGFLGLEDIYNLKLPVDLVVLSACQTALGEEISGEGLVGLTRGFMYAGASRVVASLWSVDDRATSELMTKFYSNMEKRKMAPAAALREAQIEMWRQKAWRSPYYWAAFQIQGDWN